MEEVSITGKISSVTPCGRFGVVKLDSTWKDHDLAVVNMDTNGRIGLMNPAGALEKNTKVEVSKLRQGVDAAFILKIADCS